MAYIRSSSSARHAHRGRSIRVSWPAGDGGEGSTTEYLLMQPLSRNISPHIRPARTGHFPRHNRSCRSLAPEEQTSFAIVGIIAFSKAVALWRHSSCQRMDVCKLLSARWFPGIDALGDGSTLRDFTQWVIPKQSA